MKGKCNPVAVWETSANYFLFVLTQTREDNFALVKLSASYEVCVWDIFAMRVLFHHISIKHYPHAVVIELKLALSDI